ncbi:MAG: prepilin peptidase [Planctomycetia bacterium]|nr:prepilin peptidase [Planctomycetia bacterium]
MDHADVGAWAEELATATIAIFSCLLAANLGSFLNVVMHRGPRGQSVARGGSRCPRCGSRVRWRDNVPVLGWLMLGGRCRDCRGPISPRYPLVEAAAAAVGGVVAAELLAGGRLMPGTRFESVRTGADALLMHADWSFLLLCATHGALLMTLLAWALCELDRVAVAPRWFATAVGGLGGLAIVAGGPLSGPGWPALTSGLLGMLAGVVVGACVRSRWLREAFVLAGAVLGWQGLLTAVALMPVAALVRSALTVLAPPDATGRRTPAGPCCADLCVAVAGQILTWRWLAQVWMQTPS